MVIFLIKFVLNEFMKRDLVASVMIRLDVTVCLPVYRFVMLGGLEAGMLLSAYEPSSHPRTLVTLETSNP